MGPDFSVVARLLVGGLLPCLMVLLGIVHTNPEAWRVFAVLGCWSGMMVVVLLDLLGLEPDQALSR